MKISLKNNENVLNIEDTVKLEEIERFISEAKGKIKVSLDGKEYSMSKKDIDRIKRKETPKSAGGIMICLAMRQIEQKEKMVKEIIDFLKGNLFSLSNETFISEEDLGKILKEYADDFIAETEFSAKTGRKFF